MFPNITFVSVTDQLEIIYANPLLMSLFALSLALAYAPKLLRLLKNTGRR